MSGRPQIIRVQRYSDLEQARLEMNLRNQWPVLVLVGGASRMAAEALRAVSAFLTTHLIPALDRWGVAVVDGGTDAGLMRAMGQARQAFGGRFPLVGVAPEGTVVLPGDTTPPGERARLEPNHTHMLLVPGQSWGDESPWLSALASAISGMAPSVTLLINGGEISYDDVEASLRASRPLFVLEGTGRTADLIAGAARGQQNHPRASAIAASRLTRVLQLTQPEAVLAAVGEALGVRKGERSPSARIEDR